jgi:hypothetical protein
MKSRWTPVLVVAATLLAGAAGAASRESREIIKVDRPALVAGSVIPAGTYRVELSADMDAVKLVRGTRTVVETPCTVALTPFAYTDALTYRKVQGSQDRLIKIVLASSNLAIELPTDAEVATLGSAADAAERP